MSSDDREEPVSTVGPVGYGVALVASAAGAVSVNNGVLRLVIAIGGALGPSYGEGFEGMLSVLVAAMVGACLGSFPGAWPAMRLMGLALVLTPFGFPFGRWW